jgi:hypothetical protein
MTDEKDLRDDDVRAAERNAARDGDFGDAIENHDEHGH